MTGRMRRTDPKPKRPGIRKKAVRCADSIWDAERERQIAAARLRALAAMRGAIQDAKPTPKADTLDIPPLRFPWWQNVCFYIGAKLITLGARVSLLGR